MKHFLLASDFDQTLSFNDSGHVLSELIGTRGFDEKVAGLARINLVQQGGELAYLIRHDPEFRGIRREHLVEVGRHVRLKKNIDLLAEVLADGIEGYSFAFRVISAAPREVIQSALAGIVPPEHVFGTELDYDPETGEVRSVRRVPAGYGKVAVLEELEATLGISPDRTVYVGDGSSDVHVMLHVNNRDGFTIAVSENEHIARIAKRTVLSDNALSVIVPVLEQIAGWTPVQIRELFESRGLALQGWEKARTDWVTLREIPVVSPIV
jgi:phosphoserine phosphatase